MNGNQIKIFPLGENALTIEFANEISPEINDRVINIANILKSKNFEGFIELVPAYVSLTVFYDVTSVRKNFSAHATAFDAVKSFVSEALANFNETAKTKPEPIEIPVRFGGESGLDLEYVAATNNLKPSEVIEIFTATIYRVYMLGFLPGFAYMGEVDGRIATPRKSSPRLKTPKGSVGIAGRQTGVYPLESPGGWQIIGTTDIELFTPEAETPTFFQPGDLVKFYPQN